MKTTAAVSYSKSARLASLPGVAAVRLLVLATNAIGYRNSLRLGSAIGALLYSLSGRMKAKIYHNLALAYGDSLSRPDTQEIARKVLCNFGKNWTELFYVGGRGKHTVLSRTSIQGRQNLDDALAQGNGVIAVSAHIGNYPLIGTKLAEEGYRFCMVVRDLDTAAGSLVYAEARSLISLPSLTTVPERRFFKKAIETLKNGGILCLIADENKRRGGIFVDFFGRPAATAPGPAGLALRTGAAVVPMFIQRLPDDSHLISIEPCLPAPDSADPDKSIHQLTAAYTGVIERYVKKDPPQWMWTNWRWRTQPWGQSRSAKMRKRRPVKAALRKIKSLLK